MNGWISLNLAAVLLVGAPLADAAQNLSRHATVAPDAAIEVSNIEGRVDVSAWERNEVELTARLESDEDRLEFTAGERQLRIKVERPKGRAKGAHDAVLTLRIPQGARLSVQTVSADIAVAGVKGEQRLNTVSGEVTTQAFDEPVTLRSVSGDGVISGNGGQAAVTVTSVSGSTRVDGIRGSFEGQIVSGDLNVDVAAAERLKIRSISGDVEARAELLPGARAELESVSGTMGLRIQAPVSAEFELESFSGDIDNCFGAQAQNRNARGSGRELRFTQGDGAARVRIKSMSGDITVCDR